MKQHRVIWSTAVLCIIAVGLNVVGNYSLRVGLEHVGMVKSWSPLPYVRAFAHLWVCLGVTFMFGWLIARLILLSWADLSYVLPVTSFSYVLTAVVGAIYLKETVTPLQWLGIWIITGGVAMVARTFPRTSENPKI